MDRFTVPESVSNVEDEVLRKVRQIPEGFMLDFVAFTKGTAEQEGLVDLSIVVSASCGHMYGPVSFWHTPIITRF
jgi:hypothetical protein